MDGLALRKHVGGILRAVEKEGTERCIERKVGMIKKVKQGSRAAKGRQLEVEGRCPSAIQLPLKAFHLQWQDQTIPNSCSNLPLYHPVLTAAVVVRIQK